MNRNFFKVLFALTLSLIAACGDKPENEVGLVDGVVAVAPDVPEVKQTAPETGPELIPEANPTMPAQPPQAVPPSIEAQLPGGQWKAELVNELRPLGDAQVVSRHLEKIDVTQTLVKVFPFLTQTITRNGIPFISDPLSGIHPQDGSVRFVNSSPLDNQASFVEVSFHVNFPLSSERIPVEDAARVCGLVGQAPYAQEIRSFRTDWVEFDLKACDRDGRCTVIADNMPPLTTCDVSVSATCEQNYRTKIDASQLPGGRITGNEFFLVEIVATQKAKYVDDCNAFKPCASDDECGLSHPFCEQNTCTAIKGWDYYEGRTPEALR